MHCYRRRIRESAGSCMTEKFAPRLPEHTHTMTNKPCAAGTHTSQESKPISKGCQACHSAPATGVWLVITRTMFGREKITLERRCAGCGLAPRWPVIKTNLLASLIGREPDLDSPPGLKQTATTGLSPQAAIELPNGQVKTVVEVITDAKRSKHPSTIHPSLIQR